jgi:hypothetical protein
MDLQDRGLPGSSVPSQAPQTLTEKESQPDQAGITSVKPNTARSTSAGLSFVTQSGSKIDDNSRKLIRKHVMRDYLRKKESNPSSLVDAPSELVSNSHSSFNGEAANPNIDVLKFRLGPQGMLPFKPKRPKSTGSKVYEPRRSTVRVQEEFDSQALQDNQSQVVMNEGTSSPSRESSMVVSSTRFPSPTQTGSFDPFDSLPLPASPGLQELVHGHRRSPSILAF